MNDLTAFAQPAAESVRDFMAALERTSALTPSDAWKALVKTSPVIKTWKFFLSLDPYTRWGLVKPRGYAGDATLMDFAYGHSSIHDHVSQAGPAHRPLGVVSVAAGHARELEGLDAAARSRVSRFTAIDMDPASLLETRRSAGTMPFDPVRRNVIKDEIEDIPLAGLVYSFGLFDYLSDEHAERVLAKMVSIVAPGGTCVVANLAPDAANLGYCEAIMDWWMVTRDEAAMQAPGDRVVAARGGSVASVVRKQGCFNYLTIGET